VLIRQLEPKREEAQEDGKLHNVGLHNLYSSLNTVRMITSRRVRLAGYGSKVEIYKRFGLKI
jgi:hypothetical protein